MLAETPAAFQSLSEISEAQVRINCGPGTAADPQAAQAQLKATTQRLIAALRGETIPEPESEEDSLSDDDLPPQSSLTLPERLQLTADEVPGGR